MNVSVESAVGLRERQKSARRAALVESAQTLVLAHGLDAVTVEAISARAGVSTRTFFNYFESKDDAVLGLPEVHVDPAPAAQFTAGGPSGDLLEDIAALVGAMLTALTPQDGWMCRTQELLRREPRLVPRQLAWFEEHHAEIRDLLAARRRTCPTDLDDELGCQVAVVLIQSAAAAWDRTGGTGDPVDHLATVVRQLRLLAGGSPAH